MHDDLRQHTKNQIKNYRESACVGQKAKSASREGGISAASERAERSLARVSVRFVDGNRKAREHFMKNYVCERCAPAMIMIISQRLLTV